MPIKNNHVTSPLLISKKFKKGNLTMTKIVSRALDMLKVVKVFFKIDLTHGYHQKHVRQVMRGNQLLNERKGT